MQDEITARIAADLGISSLPIEDQKSLITQFGEVALKSATIAVAEKLAEAKRDDFIRLAEAGDAAALKSFLDAEVPEHEELVKAAIADEIKRFKDFQAEK